MLTLVEQGPSHTGLRLSAMKIQDKFYNTTDRVKAQTFCGERESDARPVPVREEKALVFLLCTL